MCKICGRRVASGEDWKVKMGGSMRTVCDSCIDKEVPMLTPAPGAATLH